MRSEPRFDLVSRTKEKDEAQALAESLYLQAVLFKTPECKIAFFDAYSRARSIEQSIDTYLGV